MIIKAKTLELISKRMGEMQSGNKLIELLKECGVSPSLIVYPNTKWRMVFEVLNFLSSSEKDENHKILCTVIEQFVHPLTLGNEYLSQQTIETFNQWLKYDGLELILNNNGVSLCGEEPEEELKKEEELYNQEVKKGIDFVKLNLENLILLKKTYQIFINIIDSFFLGELLKPDEKLNKAYVKIRGLITETYSKISSNADNPLIEVNFKALILSYPYLPFINLFGAEIEHNGWIDKKGIMAKMNHFLGQVIDLCFDCEASDVITKSKTQKMLNEITLYLTEIKEKEYTNTKNSNKKVESKTTQKIEWRDNFIWEGNKFIFGEYGNVDFKSDDRKTLFEQLTVTRGNWAKVSSLKGMKDSNYVRATIKQIEDRFVPKLKKHVSIPSTQDDNLEPKPSEGAYRIKFIP